MISFNPPIHETTILNVPFHAGHLTFTATVTTGQLDVRSTIQIWSDIPDNSQPSISREQQGWSPRSFKFQGNASVASLSIPFQDFIHPSRSQFSLTYRILHPDGQIQWLGEFGKNGLLIVNRYDDRLVLFGDWASNSPGHSFTPKSAIKAPLQVFSLSDKIQWRCWDLSNSAPRLLSAGDGPSRISSALLVPSQSKMTVIPLSPILLTSRDVQVTIHPNARSVYVTSLSRGGLLSLQTLSPDALNASLAAAVPSVISIPDPDGRHALLLANPDRVRARLFAIPLSAESSASVPSTLSFPLSSILSHIQFLSNASFSRFSISNPVRFISTSADQIQLSVIDFGGAQFSLSPVYDLVKPDGDVRLSLLAKHNRIATPTSHSLLTPPPSPPLSATETETETETQALHSPEDNHELPDPVPAVHVHHVDDQMSQPTEPALASGQSTPNLAIREQLTSGQSTPKHHPVASDSGDPTPNITRPVQKGAIRKLISFVLRILAFYTRMLSKIVLAIFARLFVFHVPKKELVVTPKVRTVEFDDDQTEIKSTSVSSAVHTPTALTPRAGTPRRQYSGASTPMLRDDVINSVPGVAETIEAVTTKIVPQFATKNGEEEKPQEDLGGSCIQEPKPEPDIGNEKSGHNEKWEVVHRPGIVFELADLPSTPAQTEGEAPPKTKPIRLTLDGEENVVKELKFHLDDVELTNIKIEPLTSTGQEGLWATEIPRTTRDLVTLRIS